MSFRKRHRWLRRLALGLALVTAVSLGGATAAAAKRGDGPGVAVYVSGQAPSSVAASSIRPDDLAGRFAHSDVAPAQMSTKPDAWTFQRSDALILAVGALVLGFGLALALGYLRRPRLAGL
jgi:hypothetical protein